MHQPDSPYDPTLAFLAVAIATILLMLATTARC